jgi:CxxC motif-containing protein (DUF1111 family)
MHDGRAITIEQAIRDHVGNGSEANLTIERFDALSAEERELLLTFVRTL